MDTTEKVNHDQTFCFFFHWIQLHVASEILSREVHCDKTEFSHVCECDVGDSPFFTTANLHDNFSARLNVTQATLVYFYSRLLSLTNSTSTLLLLYFQDFDQNPWDGNVRWTTRLYDRFSSLHRCDYRCCSLSQARARNSIRCWLWLINILHATLMPLDKYFLK